MKTWSRRLAVVALLSGAAALAQPPGPQPGSRRGFFDAVTATPSTDLATREGQRYLQALQAVGRHDLHAEFPSRMLRPGVCAQWPNAEQRSLPIAAAIAELARGTRIVIVNEAHDESRHREVVRELAIELRKHGYAYFAAEAFSARIDQYPAEPFGRTDAGYYVLEPAFGQLVRTVKGLGYTLVPYEHEAGQRSTDNPVANIEEREEGQANNLVARIFAVDPAAKALIHVGYSHAAEVALPTFGKDIEWMAARLKAKTGIDPLTVDQTRCAAAGEALELAAVSSDVPPGAHDVAVAHPVTRLFRGRPQWRIDAGDIAIELPDTLVVDGVRTLIEARYESEPPDTIPLDRLLLRSGERLPLLLRVGAIRIEQFFEDGRTPRTLVLNVK